MIDRIQTTLPHQDRDRQTDGSEVIKTPDIKLSPPHAYAHTYTYTHSLSLTHTYFRSLFSSFHTMLRTFWLIEATVRLE